MRFRRRVGELLRRSFGTAPVSPRAYAESVSDPHYFHRRLAPSGVQRAPLPGNVNRRRDLPSDRSPWGFSFHDVPERRIEPRCVARLPECRVVPYRNRWGSEFHSIVTRDGRALRLRGVAPLRDQVMTPVEAVPLADFEEAAWIVGRWHRNYYHWLVYHLPQAMVLQDQGASGRMLIPRQGALSGVIDDSLAALGVDLNGLRPLPEGTLRADPLWVVESDRFDPNLLRALRARVAVSDEAPDRRVYLSREHAKKRRLAAAGSAVGFLARAGFEVVRAEELSFREQVALASRTEILVGVHGAGLANMVFMPKGAHVIEIAHPRYPSPAFYALASALGLEYWILWGAPADARGREALDVEVDVGELERVIAAIERRA